MRRRPWHVRLAHGHKQPAHHAVERCSRLLVLSRCTQQRRAPCSALVTRIARPNLALLGHRDRRQSRQRPGQPDAASQWESRPANGRRGQPMAGALSQSEARLMETYCLLALPAVKRVGAITNAPRPKSRSQNATTYGCIGRVARIAFRPSGPDSAPRRACSHSPGPGTWCLTIPMLPLAASVAMSASSRQHPASRIWGTPLPPPPSRAWHLDPGGPRSTRSPDQGAMHAMHATPP
jgi:hypothetical protein